MLHMFTQAYTFFFNYTETTEIYTLSLHDALPIFHAGVQVEGLALGVGAAGGDRLADERETGDAQPADEQHRRSEEHTSELQSRQYLVCRLLLEKKSKNSFARLVMWFT